MAEIKPIRAWRYNQDLSQQIESLTSPLFDVVSTKQRKALYTNPLNSIHLSVPAGENPALQAKETLATWKEKGIIKQDALPGIYVYYQYYSLPGSDKEYCRKGFICHIKAYDWPENVVLRHENTIPSSVNDRISLLENTELHVSPTHGLYTDAAFTLEGYMDECMKAPIYETEDYQGVRDVLGVIHDASIIRLFMDTLKDRKVILADGHHRYESSLAYRKRSTENNPAHTGFEAYNYHMMYLTNTEAGDLRILPTHRLIKGITDFDADLFVQKLSAYFIIKELESPFEVNEIILGKKWAFGLILKDKTYKIRLKPEVFGQMEWKFPEEVKQLDLTVLHYFVIAKVLNIPGNEQRTSEHISFDRNFAECVALVMKDEVQMALITNEISMQDVKKVCTTGYTMPQKSTYFYPKVICGFLFSSIKQEEFESVADLSFAQ
jgi:uncharacterized protein (DUF1015 family)